MSSFLKSLLTNQNSKHFLAQNKNVLSRQLNCKFSDAPRILITGILNKEIKVFFSVIILK
jgi:hypothetical protein